MRVLEDNCLAHYGVSGQKWGVRRYQNEDGSLTELGKQHYSVTSGGNEKFDKKYREEVSKFKKLADKADPDTQKELADKMTSLAKKSAKVGAGAALTTASLVGLNKVGGDIMSKYSHNALVNMVGQENYAKNLDKLASTEQLAKELLGIDMTQKERDFYAKRSAGAWDRLQKMEDQAAAVDKAYGIANTINSVAAVVSALTATTALGTAAYSGLTAAAAKHRLTDKGHAKAVARRDAQYDKISNMVKDTPYVSLFRAQIAAYKKEHPNTELSDKQIMKNLM